MSVGRPKLSGPETYQFVAPAGSQLKVTCVVSSPGEMVAGLGSAEIEAAPDGAPLATARWPVTWTEARTLLFWSQSRKTLSPT